MTGRSRWGAADAEGVDYLLSHRADELDAFELGLLSTLSQKRPGRDTVSWKQRELFDGLWRQKAPSHRVQQEA